MLEVMKYIGCFFLFVVTTVNAQNRQFSFAYLGSDPSCNPFKDEVTLLRNDSKWKVSHGTPEVKDLYGNGFYNVGKLGAERNSIGEQKSEGLFIDYNFLCTHSYTVSIALRHGGGDMVGVRVLVANGLAEKSNSNCSFDVVPKPTDLFEIYKSIDSYDGALGDFQAVTVSNWKPSRDFNSIWLYPETSLINEQGSIYVDYVAIYDNGEYRTTCPTSPPPPSPYPYLSGLEIRPDFLSINEESISYDFLWNPSSGLSSDEAGYAIWVNDQFVWDNYDSDGDIFKPEKLDGKLKKRLTGKLCDIELIEVQGYNSSGAPNSKWTWTRRTPLWATLVNVDVVVDDFVLPPTVSADGVKIFATSSVNFLPGFHFKSENGIGLNAKIINCAAIRNNGRIAGELNGEPMEDLKLSLEVSYNYYSKLKDLDEASLIVLNPVRNTVRISGLNPFKKYHFSILSEQGVLLDTRSHYDNTNNFAELNVQFLSVGFYILNVTVDNKSTTYKIIKN